MSFEKFFFFTFLISTAIFLVPWIHANDGAGYYSLTRSVVVDNDLNLKNEHDYFEESFKVNSIQEDERTGLWYSQYPIGVSLLQLPFVWFIHIFSKGDGYSLDYIYAACLSAVIFGFFGMVLCFKFCKKYFDEKIAFISVMVFWLSSNLFYYMFLESSLSHAYSFFAVSLFLYFFFTMNKEKLLNWVWLGLISALVVMVRYQDGIIFIIPFIFFLKDLILFPKSIFSDLQEWLVYECSFFIGMSLQLFTLLYYHGNFSLHYQSSYNFFQSFTHFFMVLFSTNHGVFLWTPIFLIGFLGLFYGIKNWETKEIVIYFLIVFCLSTFFIAGLRDWSGAQGFGHRMFLNMGFIIVFGLCFVLRKVMELENHKILCWIMVLIVLWNFFMMFCYGMRIIPSEGSVNFLKIIPNIWNYIINIVK